MMISHIALWTVNLNEMKIFYEKYFGAHAGPKYENPKKHFESYFLSFDSGIRIELMKKVGVGFAQFADENGVSGQQESARYVAPEHAGYSHISFSLGSEAAVDALTQRLSLEGTPVLSGPRRTGDGYYESVIADPEGNLIEISI